MTISRRVLLSTVPAAALLAVAQPLRARAATTSDLQTLIGNTVAMLAGTGAGGDDDSRQPR